MNYKTYNDLAQDIKQSVAQIPQDICLIVGIPRSGMIPAYILGAFLNLPVTSLDTFLNDSDISNGEREMKKNSGKRILIVDDSINEGSAMRKAREKIAKSKKCNEYEYFYYAAYAREESSDLVDLYALCLPHPRVFQWNYMHHGMLMQACVDIDGVLCVDPLESQNDDGDKYKNFIATAQPLCATNYPIKALVTSRLEKYRPETEKWLKDNNIQYEQLYMLDLPNKESRIRMGAHAQFKGSVYKSLSETLLFIESSPGQAKEISQISGKPVICYETDEMFDIRNKKVEDTLQRNILQEEILVLRESKSFRLGELFFRTMKSPVKWFTFPLNFAKILVDAKKINKNPRVLVVINHYYGAGKNFSGKSSTQNEEIRRGIVEKVIRSLQEIPNVDIKICGMSEFSLFPVDIDLSFLHDPSFIIYESIEWMAAQINEYDYFINIEDDILLSRETFERVIDFDRVSVVNECLHPNRMETEEGGERYCVDLRAIPDWKGDYAREYQGHKLRVAQNPHSGITILSRKKLAYALQNTDVRSRERIVGHYMASAYANIHTPFRLLRSSDDFDWHSVTHLDNWVNKTI